MRRCIKVIRKEIEYMLNGIPDHLQNINILWEDPIRNEEDYQQRRKLTAYYALWNEVGRQPPTDLLQNEKRMRYYNCLLYTSPSPRDKRQSRMPSSA